MGLTVELTRRGLGKGELAELLGVNRKTISRMGEEIEPKVQKILDEHPVLEEVPLAKKQKNWDEYTDDEIREICKRRGGLEGISERTLETDYEIAHSLGLRVFEFNKMIGRLR